MLGLTKSDWGDIHITVSLLFLVAAIFHTWYNWGALIKYIAGKLETGLTLKLETLLSVILVLFFTAGALYKIPPLDSLMALNDYVKNMWIVNKDYEPPVGHAELLTMKSFTKRLNIPLEEATEELKKNGINFAENESLAVIAKKHGTVPVEIYKLIKKLEKDPAVPAPPPEGAKPAVSAAPARPAADAGVARPPAVPPVKVAVYTEEMIDEQFEGRGIGRKTLSIFCEENGLDLALARKKLAAQKIEIKDNETLKEAATRLSSAPIEILKIIMVGEPVKK